MKRLFLFILGWSLANSVLVQGATFDQKSYEKAIREIRSKSHYQLSDHEFYEAALRGVLAKLEEKNVQSKRSDQPPYRWKGDNVLLTPIRAQQFKIDNSGHISGVGLELRYERPRDASPIVQRVFNGGAKDAGIRVGDSIVSIKGKPAGDYKDFHSIIMTLRGKTGSSVRVGVLRDGKVRQFTIKRKKIVFSTVESQVEDGTGYLKIRYFNHETFPAVQKAVQRFAKSKINGIVLDLRESRGGQVDVGEKVIALFAKKGQLLWSEKSANGKLIHRRAKKDGIARNWSASVLVGPETKSMGEVFAQFMRHRPLSLLIGEKTAGKGSIETVMSLENGYLAMFTVRMLQGPKGKTWHQKGLEPDVVIPAAKEVDNVLAAGKRFLNR